MAERLKTTKGTVSRGMAWIGLGASFVALLDILTYFIFAVVIGWEGLGTIVAVGAVFPALNKATELGLIAAIVNKDDHTPEKVATIFWINVITSVVLGLLLSFVFAPLIVSFLNRNGDFQDLEAVRWMISIYSLKLIWQNVYYIPWAFLKRKGEFKKMAVIRMLSNLAETGTKIGLVFWGAGAWSYVLGLLAGSFVWGIATQFFRPWLPKFVFNFGEAKDWMMYGLRTSASRIVFHLYVNLDKIFVGSAFGEAAAGVYGLAFHIVLTPTAFVSGVTVDVAFPLFSSLQKNISELREKFVFFVRNNLIIVLAFLAVIVAVSEDAFALTEHGKQGMYLLRILVCVSALRAMSYIIIPLLDGVGKPQLTLRYMLVAAAGVWGALLACSYLFAEWGSISVAVGWALGYPIAFAVLLWMGLREVNMTAREFWKRTRNISFIAVIAALAGLACTYGLGVALPHAHDVINSLLGASLYSLPAIRLLLSAIVTIAIFFYLLMKVEGITPVSALKTLKAK